ncbi:MAG: PfkB family carbohydrate kinase [Chloroflexi bacterium]|nr:PfkB family carbohydrate kinase [Chloroflexota bacterium]MCI0578370.1 PfkB family carbohydrate kinase [Chloroflexota bacterium]MCI0645386.1 PfkB family carbohydrate kinase [Chloroflexota bacterium]MCI0732153.1 PfkB family carbohydrate kinase [Chloroflexota bacterium]
MVLGGANADYLVRGPHLPGPGDTVHGDLFQQAPGGKGANQAVAAARLGARVAFVGCVGQDQPGEELVEALAAECVDTGLMRVDNTTHTGVALIQVAENSGQKQIMVSPGANQQLSVADVLAAAGAISSADALLLQLEVPLPTVLAAVRLAREADALVILDAAPPTELPDELLVAVTVLRLNAGEAEALTGVPVHDRQSARQAIDRLRERGLEAAIVEAGDEGNLVVSRNGEWLLPLLDVETVDTTGAGDAFAAALTVLLAERELLEKAATFANAAAALATTKIGAQAGLPYREEVEALLEQITSAT